MKTIKSHYRRGNKFYFRDGKKKCTVTIEKEGTGIYRPVREGDEKDPIAGTLQMKYDSTKIETAIYK